jgi:hypothetical protein
MMPCTPSMVATLAVNKSSEPPGKYDVNSGQADE